MIQIRSQATWKLNEGRHHEAAVIVSSRCSYHVSIDWDKEVALILAPGLNQEVDISPAHFPEDAEACAAILVAMLEGGVEL